MTTDPLTPQREILQAVEAKDDQRLKTIAEREGISPELWDYWIAAQATLDNIRPVGYPPNTATEGSPATD